MTPSCTIEWAILIAGLVLAVAGFLFKEAHNFVIISIVMIFVFSATGNIVAGFASIFEGVRESFPDFPIDLGFPTRSSGVTRIIFFEIGAFLIGALDGWIQSHGDLGFIVSLFIHIVAFFAIGIFYYEYVYVPLNFIC